MRLLKIFTALLLLASGQLMGQITLTGRVTETTSRQALAGAHVQINKSFRTWITDENGRFRIENLKAGEYTLKVSFMDIIRFLKQFNCQKTGTYPLVWSQALSWKRLSS